MDTNQANLMGYAVGARIALRHSEADGIKKACATVNDLNESVGTFVNMHAARMQKYFQKRASHVQKYYETIIG